MTSAARRSWIASLAVLLAVAATAGCTTTGSTAPESSPADEPVLQIDESVEEPASSSTPGESAEQFPGETVSQQNAREKALDYLDLLSFSRSGLVSQLEFEGFSNADAVYAVDVLKVDWNEQAAKKGAEYLKTTSFSRQGLVEQLIYEGFTPEQAEYGVSVSYAADSAAGSANTGSEGSVSQRNAVEKAQEYLKFSSFSRSGLVSQLEFEGFSNTDAVYAVDVLVVDWKEQAALKAKSYLETSAFSRQSLLDQLIFEGFTPEQAAYGVSSVGL
jgi:hypothetical protein